MFVEEISNENDHTRNYNSQIGERTYGKSTKANKHWNNSVLQTRV